MGARSSSDLGCVVGKAWVHFLMADADNPPPPAIQNQRMEYASWCCLSLEAGNSLTIDATHAQHCTIQDRTLRMKWKLCFIDLSKPNSWNIPARELKPCPNCTAFPASRSGEGPRHRTSAVGPLYCQAPFKGQLPQLLQKQRFLFS